MQLSSLRNFRKNIYSQNGEDGILGEILRRLEIRAGAFVEFGAWDGKHLSNTFYLLEQGWRGIYIESDKNRYQELVDKMKVYSERIELINAFVEPVGESSLDNLLASTRINREFEVLSIDVDSCDWQIWQSFRNYDPKIVIIEIESTIPVGIYQTHRGTETPRSSFTATVDLGSKKGYTLVCHTGNLIFVKNNLVPDLKLPENDIQFPETLFDYSWKHLSYESHKHSWLNLISRVLNFRKRC